MREEQRIKDLPDRLRGGVGHDRRDRGGGAPCAARPSARGPINPVIHRIFSPGTEHALTSPP